MKRSRFLTGFGVVFFAICLLFLIVTGAMSLLKNGSVSPNAADRGDVCEFTAFAAGKVLEMKHTLNFIPTGKEHYYLAVSEDGLVQFLVRAKPSWIDKHFDDSGFAEDGVTIKGRIVRAEYEMIKEINEINIKLMQSGVITSDGALSTNYYIDARYKEFGLLRILCGVGIIVVAVLIFFGGRSGMLPNNKGVSLIVGLVALGVAVLTIYTLSVGGSGL